MLCHTHFPVRVQILCHRTAVLRPGILLFFFFFFLDVDLMAAEDIDGLYPEYMSELI